jgi:hypothetical protein
MKTAMQELIDDLTSEIEDRKSVPATNKMYHTSTRIVQEILDFYVKPLLEKEKEQILKARFDGFKISSEGWNGEYPFEGKSDDEISYRITNQEYYNKTYNQNK